MTEELERTEIAYTHTYDQFTTFFYGNHVFIGKQEYPVGQCCVDVMNLDETILNDIDQRVGAFVPVAKDLLTEKQTAPLPLHRNG